MILVTGATGHLGAATLHFLLEKRPASSLAAFVRNADKADGLAQKGISIRVGTYDDTSSLDRAMTGIDTVLLIAGTDEENRLRQHQNVVDSAKRAGVQRIAYTSRALKDRTTLVNKLMNGHFQTEDYIRASGMAYTLFQNGLYMDVLPQFVGPTVFERGISVPAGDGTVSFALRTDMAAAMANALAAAGNTPTNEVYKLTGSESYSFADVAEALTTLSGKQVSYTPAEKSAFEAGMRARGLPDVVVQRVTGFITDIKNGQEADVSHDLEILLGRKPTPLLAGLKTLFAL